MRYLIEEISKLRKGRSFSMSDALIDRYRICVKEENGTKTSYCTSVPICKKETNVPIEQIFKNDGGICVLEGSNSNIMIDNDIVMESEFGSCTVMFGKEPIKRFENYVECENICLYPSSNGVICKVKASVNDPFTFVIKSDELFLNTRSNNKYFSFMRAKFRPLVTVSAIATLDRGDRFISPAFISYVRLEDNAYEIKVWSENNNAEYIIFEINMYDEKLLQDTTVESRNPGTNNSFGSVAFLGNTLPFGEQWLYCRPDFTKIPELFEAKINKSTIHYPRFDNNGIKLTAYKVASRFCSFGSNWSNRIANSYSVGDSELTSDYHSIDITDLLADPYSGELIYSDGWILKTQYKVSDFTIITTGDSHFAPVIIEINHN